MIYDMIEKRFRGDPAGDRGDFSTGRIYRTNHFANFKIEGRSLGSAIVLEFLLYYMTKPEHQLEVREKIYLDNTLDLF